MEETYLEKQCKWLNETVGKMDESGFWCEKCKNKRLLFFIKNDSVVSKHCSCVGVRKSLKIIKESGLDSMLKAKTFEGFIAKEEWQKEIKKTSMLFPDNEIYRTFFIGGQCGSGKTHLCTSICGEFIKKMKNTLYLLWTRDVRELKAVVNEQSFFEKMERYKNVEVLYIDDFLKVMKGTKPTAADMNIAFEILNSRLLDPEKITVISSEFTIEELVELDEGTASRICENAGPFVINIAREREKNHRLRKWL